MLTSSRCPGNGCDDYRRHGSAVPCAQRSAIAPRLLFALALMPSLAAAQPAESLYTEQPALTPELAAAGEWPVGVATLAVTNPDQLDANDLPQRKDRKLVLELWYPAIDDQAAPRAAYSDVTRLHKPFRVLGQARRDSAPAKQHRFPLVVLSHGYTGYRTLMFYLGEHLASHGYVVASIDHTDSTNAEIDFVNNRGAGFASTLLHRARDQQFVLEQLAGLDSPLGKIIDARRASIVGYSMGGYGAVNVVGGCYNYTSEIVQTLGVPESAAASLAAVYSGCNGWRESADPRWKAMIAFAPWGQRLGMHDVRNVSIPSLYVTGDKDDISGYESGVRALYEQTGSRDKYLLVFENARHNVAPHPAPTVAYESDADLGHYAEASWSTEQLNRVNKHMALAFLDCHVLKSLDACAYLPQREDVTQTRDADGKLSAAWPGFNDRWGTGIRFYRGQPSATD